MRYFDEVFRVRFTGQRRAYDTPHATCLTLFRGVLCGAMFCWQVCTQPGWTAQGTQGQKRLILDHASEMYAQLRSGAGKKLVLEAGYGPEEGEEGDITLCKVSRTAQSTALRH